MIVRAIADQRGDDGDFIREGLENPDDYDALVSRARALLDDPMQLLRWQGRALG